MAEPQESKRELIVLDIVETLKEISRDDGYWYDVDPDSVTRLPLPLDALDETAMPWFSVIGDAETAGTEFMPRKDRANFDVLIYGIVRASEPAMKETELERAVRDVRKIVMEDQTRSNAALWTHVVEIEPPEAGNIAFADYAFFRMRVRVCYDFVWSEP